jgi:hypothetical protein
VSVLERFEEKIAYCPMSGCWLWTASVDMYGYGRIRVDGKSRKASRVSWELHRGPIPGDLHVCHHCDTPSCVNPDHLFLGTRSDNQRDCEIKGRRTHARGEQSNKAKMTATKVLEARARSAAGEKTRQLARAYGISQPSMKAILRRKAWAHV